MHMTKQTMSPEQAVNTLYALTRRAPLSANDHDVARECALILLEELKPKTGKAESKKK